MNVPPHEERTVRRLRNDVDDIYDLLGAVQSTVEQHSVTLDEHTVTLAEHGTVLDQHTEKLDKIIGILETR